MNWLNKLTRIISLKFFSYIFSSLQLPIIVTEPAKIKIKKENVCFFNVATLKNPELSCPNFLKRLKKLGHESSGLS